MIALDGEKFKIWVSERCANYKDDKDKLRLSHLVNALKETTFFIEPASAKYHLAYERGLFYHSFNVATALRDLTEKLNLQWISESSPEIIGLTHDLCKLNAYVKKDDGTYVSNKNNDKEWNEKFEELKGRKPYSTEYRHGELSLLRASEILELTEEEKACIRWHMGAFCPYKEWNMYTTAVAQFNNVLYTHTADMIATKIMENS